MVPVVEFEFLSATRFRKNTKKSSVVIQLFCIGLLLLGPASAISLFDFYLALLFVFVVVVELKLIAFHRSCVIILHKCNCNEMDSDDNSATVFPIPISMYYLFEVYVMCLWGCNIETKLVRIWIANIILHTESNQTTTDLAVYIFMFIYCFSPWPWPWPWTRLWSVCAAIWFILLYFCIGIIWW